MPKDCYYFFLTQGLFKSESSEVPGRAQHLRGPPESSLCGPLSVHLLGMSRLGKGSVCGERCKEGAPASNEAAVLR